MDTVKEGIRRNLIEMLAMSGKRNVDLAEACGVGKSAVSNWLNGNSSIDIERIPSICDFFGVTIDEFFGRSKEMQPSDNDIGLTDNEQKLVDLYRQMDAQYRAMLLKSAEAYVGASVKEDYISSGAVPA